MSTTQIVLNPPASSNLFAETAIGSTALAVKASAATLYTVDVDNTANAAASYLKLWNVASGSVTVGTTAPDEIYLIPASTRVLAAIPQGKAFGTALTVACVTTAGTAGTTAPTSAVICRIVYT